MKHFSQNQQR